MQFVMIKPFALSVDAQPMQVHLYTIPLRVIEETEHEILIYHKDDHVHAFWFDKKYIDRFI